MGQCLSLVSEALKPTQQQGQQQHQQHTEGTTSQPNKPSDVLSYAAVAAGSALHSLADKLEAQGGSSTGAGNGSGVGSGNGDVQRPNDLDVEFVLRDAVVVKMPDGDSLTVEAVDKTRYRVRIQGIDCPETTQNFGAEARAAGASILSGSSTVTLYVHCKDRYGRLVATVVTEQGLDFSKEMLKRGACWHYKAYDRRESLAELERAAKLNKIGLWSFPRPQEPWVYRRRKREKQEKKEATR